MRICLATDSPAPSGMGVHMLTLADALGEHDIVFLAPRDTALFAEARQRYAVKALPEDGGALARYLRTGGFDLVHLHAGIGWEGHEIADAAAAAGVPVIRSEHLPFLLTDTDQQTRYAETSGRLAATIAVSEAVAQSYAASGLCAASPVTIRNGIAPLTDAGGAVRYERFGERPMLLNIGRLAAQKNQTALIDAAVLLAEQGRPVDLVLVGEGPDRAALLAHIAARKAQGYVRLMGHRADVSALMRVADLYVHASAFEGLPLVLLEAMAAGLPIVARPAPGVDEALDIETALLADGGDAEALAAAIATALDRPEEARRRAEAAQQRQQTLFSASRLSLIHI